MLVQVMWYTLATDFQSKESKKNEPEIQRGKSVFVPLSTHFQRQVIPKNLDLFFAELSGSVSAFSRYILGWPGTSNAKYL